MRSLHILGFSLALLLLTACGGGGSGASSPAVETQQATGVWVGTVTQQGFGTFDVLGIIYGDQLRFISPDAGTIYEGAISVSGDRFTAHTSNYEIGGSLFSTATLTGTVYTKSSMEGTFVANDGARGSFELIHDPMTDRGANLARVDANWSATDGWYTLVLSVNAQGQLTGSDSDGCVFNGRIDVQDPAVNIYAVTLDATSCGVANGRYSGYAVVNDTYALNDTLSFVVSNSQYIFVGDLYR